MECVHSITEDFDVKGITKGTALGGTMDIHPMLEHLRKVAESLRTKIEETKVSLAEHEEDLRGFMRIIAFYERSLATRGTAQRSMDIGFVKAGIFGASNLRGMSHRKAVIAIARNNGGIVRAQEAKRLMIQAEVMKDTKNATHMVHNAIITSERFERIGRGEYRLKTNGPSAPGTPALTAGVFSAKPPLQ